MVVSGDWVTPRLNDLKYFEKPAFQYWMTAISYELFGISNASARLWLAIAGFATALFTGFLAGRLYGRGVGASGIYPHAEHPAVHGRRPYYHPRHDPDAEHDPGDGFLILAQHYRADSKPIAIGCYWAGPPSPWPF